MTALARRFVERAPADRASYLGRVFSGLVYGVAPTDLFTFACVGARLAGVSMVACYLPVRRIASIDTAAILRG